MDANHRRRRLLRACSGTRSQAITRSFVSLEKLDVGSESGPHPPRPLLLQNRKLLCGQPLGRAPGSSVTSSSWAAAQDLAGKIAQQIKPASFNLLRRCKPRQGGSFGFRAGLVASDRPANADAHRRSTHGDSACHDGSCFGSSLSAFRFSELHPTSPAGNFSGWLRRAPLTRWPTANVGNSGLGRESPAAYVLVRTSGSTA